MGKHETLIIIYLLKLSTAHSTDEREVFVNLNSVVNKPTYLPI